MTDAYWGWRVKATGRKPNFDADAAREAAAWDDPNPKGRGATAGHHDNDKEQP